MTTKQPSLQETAPQETAPYPRVAIPVLGGIAALMALVLWLAPLEQTLGAGIRIVYIHVALIWTGMLQLVVAGILGLILLITESPGVQQWVTTISRVGFGFLTAAVVASLWAEIVNWGAILWSEPRTRAMLQLLAVALIARVLYGWIRQPRIQGLLHLLVALFLVASTLLVPRFFHPDDPIGSSTATAIQLTFYSLFSLCFIAGLWIMGYIHHDQAAPSL